MELYEISSEFANIWNTFFSPFVEFAVICAVIYFITGEELEESVGRKKVVTFQDIQFRKKKGVYVPISRGEKKLFEILRSNILILFFLLLVLVYGCHKILEFVGYIFPLTFSFQPEQLLLLSSDQYTLAGIWSYAPNLPFDELYNQIDIIAKESNPDVFNNLATFHYNILDVAEFLILLSIVLLWIPKPKRTLKRIIRVTLVFVVSMMVMFGTYVHRFKSIISETEQKCYLTLQQYQIENGNEACDNESFEECNRKLALIEESYDREEKDGTFEFCIKSKFDFENYKKVFQSISFFERS